MKWPKTLTVVRHGESAYNALKAQKEADPSYQAFKEAFESDRQRPRKIKRMAKRLVRDGRLVLGTGDHDTELSAKGEQQAQATGARLSELIEKPDIIFVSPYLRTKETLRFMSIGWAALEGVKVIEDERLREQEHGLALLYNDWRIFHALNPEQARLYNMQGAYWYRYPQGENVPDGRERNRSWLGALARDFADKEVLVVGHHLNKLSLRANLERLDEHGFADLDEHQKPINGGVTIYRGDPNQGRDGKLILDVYNQRLYGDDLAS